MNAKQLLEQVIRPTLDYLNMGGISQERLILGTAAQESRMGEYLVQIKGPARGIWQMEPFTEQDLWENYISYRHDLDTNMRYLLAHKSPNPSHLVTNLAYACAMARLVYRRAPEPIPNDVEGMAALWKLRYNTPKGKGTEAEFIENYHRFVGDL